MTNKQFENGVKEMISSDGARMVDFDIKEVHIALSGEVSKRRATAIAIKDHKVYKYRCFTDGNGIGISYLGEYIKEV